MLVQYWRDGMQSLVGLDAAVSQCPGWKGRLHGAGNYRNNSLYRCEKGPGASL